MNIQEAVKAIQQNGEAMRRVSWRTTRLTIKEYEDTNYRTHGSVTRATLLDERYGVWKPTVSDLTADDWEVCRKMILSGVRRARPKRQLRRPWRNHLTTT